MKVIKARLVSLNIMDRLDSKLVKINYFIKDGEIYKSYIYIS